MNNCQMKKEMEDFIIRVMAGGEEVEPQETAILPKMVEIWASMPDENTAPGMNETTLFSK